MESNRTAVNYTPLPTLRLFHESSARNRCIVGPVGSGKTSACCVEIGYYLPMFFHEHWGIKKTRWAIIRNTYKELNDSTLKSIQDTWFPWGTHRVQKSNFEFSYPNGIQVEFWLRACDRPDQVKMFKSMELTGAWFEESIEIDEQIKAMVKNRIGRFPPRSPAKFSIESTNPPDIEHPLFSNYKWIVPPPDFMPQRPPLEDYEGFWQPPYENVANLPPGYYEDLRKEYRDSQEWIDMYIEGKPGAIAKGRLVYYDFSKRKHVSTGPIKWQEGRLYRGWDNTGNQPACVVVQISGRDKAQVLKEFVTDRMGIVDFTQWVQVECNMLYPGCEFIDYGDPAGESKQSNPIGGLISNADMMRAEGVIVVPSEQNFDARVESVQKQIRIENGLEIDPSCVRLINGFLAGYHFEQIGGTGIYKDYPSKNKYSHVHDALQYVMARIFRTSQANDLTKKYTQAMEQYYNSIDVDGI